MKMRDLIKDINETLAICIDAQYVRFARRGEATGIADIYTAYDPQVLLTPVGMSDFLNKIDQSTLSFFVAMTDQLTGYFSNEELAAVVDNFETARQSMENLLDRSIIMGPDLAKDRSDIGRYFRSLAISRKYRLSLFEFVVHRFFVVFHDTNLFNSTYIKG